MVNQFIIAYQISQWIQRKSEGRRLREEKHMWPSVTPGVHVLIVKVLH